MARGAAAAGAANMFGRLSGLARDMVFTAIFGAGVAADAYLAAVRIPSMFRELLAEGSLSNVFVPLFAERDQQDGPKAAWALANALLGVLLLLLGGVTLLMFVAAEPLVWLVAAGFDQTPGKVELTAWLTRWMAPFLAGLSVASLFGGMLNVRGRFFLPAMAPSFLNLLVIAACLLGDSWQQLTGIEPIGAVALATTISGLLTAAVQYPALRKLGYRFRPHLRGHADLRRVARFVGASLVGIGVVQFSLLVETQLASRFGDGPVTWLLLGFRLVQLPQTVVSSSVAVASLAGLAVLFGRKDIDGARDTLSQAMELNSLLVVPAAVGLYVLADPLIEVMYGRGAFTPNDVANTADVLRMYAIATVGICSYRVLLPVFFALQDPYTPMRLSLVVMVLKIPVALLFTDALGMGVSGLPLSHAVTVTIEVGAMAWLLRRHTDGWRPGFWSQQGRIVLASAAMGVLVWLLRPGAALLGGGGVAVVCCVGAGAYGVLVLVLGVRESRTLFERLWVRILRRPPPGAPPRGSLPPGSGPPGRPPR
jgi:putative peptidoglycan lipid II flippase